MQKTNEIRSDFDGELFKTDSSILDHWFYGKHGKDSIYFEDTFLGLKNKLLIEGLQTNTVTIHSNDNVHRLDKIYAPRSRKSYANLIQNIGRIQLIESNRIPIHAATLSNGNIGLMLPAFPNVGKSLSTLELMSHGWKYLSDDTVHVDAKGNAYLTEFPSAVGYKDFFKYPVSKNVGNKPHLKFTIYNRIRDSNKILERLIKPPLISLCSMAKTAPKAKINIVCTLEIGEYNIEPISFDEMYNSILKSNRYSLGLIDNPLIQAYAYFNPNFSLESIEQKQRDILKQFLLQGNTFYRLSCKNWDWGELFKELDLI